MRKHIIERYDKIQEVPKPNLKTLVNKTNEDFATDDVLNLISKLLELDPVSVYIYRNYDPVLNRPCNILSLVIDNIK